MDVMQGQSPIGDSATTVIEHFRHVRGGKSWRKPSGNQIIGCHVFAPDGKRQIPKFVVLGNERVCTGLTSVNSRSMIERF